MQSKRYHIICDLKNCKRNLNDSQKTKDFIEKFVTIIGMNILAGPIITNGIPENPGITALIAIDFSHISIHTFTKYDEALVDIFSCKPFDKEVALNECLDFFGVVKEDARIKEVWWG